MHTRQNGAGLVEGCTDEIGKGGIRELRLALRGPRLENAEPSRLGNAEAFEPDRRLSDACLAFDDERMRSQRGALEETLDGGKLSLTADDRLHSASRLDRQILLRLSYTAAQAP